MRLILKDEKKWTYLRKCEVIGKKYYQNKLMLQEWFIRQTIIENRAYKDDEALQKVCKELLEHSMKGLKFFISWAFNRGRNVELSEKYFICAMESVEESCGENMKCLCQRIENVIKKWEEKVNKIPKKSGKGM